MDKQYETTFEMATKEDILLAQFVKDITNENNNKL